MDLLDRETLVRLTQSGVILLVAFLLFNGLRGRILAFARWANLPRLALAPVRLTLRYGILAVAVVLVLGRWGFEVDTLLAVLGTILGLVAIGFVAVWSVLSNFLCAFVLVLFKPFAVGDEVELMGGDGVKGKVVDLSLLFTTLEVGPDETVLVPNNLFFQRIVRRRAGTVTVGLDYQLRQDRPMQAAGDPDPRSRPVS
jgi:small-conductance mechanosensitive channel